MRILVVLTTVFVLSCHPKPRLSQPVYKPGYTYVKVSPEQFHVVAESPAYLDQALKELGCGVCSVELAGQYFVVSVLK